jgi:hypothetical protein
MGELLDRVERLYVAIIVNLVVFVERLLAP